MSKMLDTKQDTGANLLDVFQPYKIPLNLSQDYLDQTDGQVHRSQERCLGISTIQVGTEVYPNCTFFEITESEISEVCNSSSSPHQEEESVPESPTSSLDGLASCALSNGMLPKKRKRRRTIRYDVIFTMDKKVSTLSNEHTFYAFPREAVTECLTTTAPHKLIFTCFPNTINKSLNCGCDTTATPVMEEASFKTKLEEFAAVCSNRCKLTLPDQTSKTEGFGMSIIISKASNELYLSMKQLASAYETMIQNAMNLVKSHNHELTKHKWSNLLPEKTAPSQSENHQDKQESWAKDITTIEETGHQPEQLQPVPPHKPVKKSIPKVKSNSAAAHARPNVSTPVVAANPLGKKCTYCGSKSTPMWRRGPEGAGTLCNACGVKWKHGKILIGNGTDAAIPAAVTQDSKPKSEKKRKRLNTDDAPGNPKRSSNKKSAEGYHREEFAMPAPKEASNQVKQGPWEGQSTTSSSADSCSPLESFSSPNTSPSSEQKRDISSLLSYDKESLSVYVGEDAVEAAALLTLLKRS